jgi:hypothetical protein
LVAGFVPLHVVKESLAQTEAEQTQHTHKHAAMINPPIFLTKSGKQA